MLKRPLLLILAVIIIILGGVAGRDQVRSLFGVSTSDEYWAETGLAAEALAELLEEESCHSSERSFLACINALRVIAQKQGFRMTPSGTLQSLDKSAVQSLTEKEALEPWQRYFSVKSDKTIFPFKKVWKRLQEEIRPEKMSAAVGLGINGFLSISRDPHTYLLPAKMYSEVVAKANPKSLSIGVVIGQADGQYFIKKVIERSSAEIAGLRKGDVLFSVNGQEAKSLGVQELGELLRGEEGSVLSLGILRNSEIKSFHIVRTPQTLPTVSSQVIEGLKPVGLLTINKFAIGACQEAREQLQSLKLQNIRGLLLDLRDNPGGQMEEATCVAGLFLGPGRKIYQIKPLDLEAEEEASYSSDEQEYGGAVAVLINAGSASASEIVAGALQDYGRAVLVGERSFGKGSFQEGELWSQNDKIALFETKGFYYLPSGRTPQMVGLEPDVKVRFIDSMALRETDQFKYPLQAPLLGSPAELVSDIQSELAMCFNFDSDFLPANDPEIKEAHRVVSCETVAERGNR